LLAGILTIFGAIFFFKALAKEEVSRVIPLFRFVAIFVLIFSTIFLGEKLSFSDYIAFVLIILGGFFISTRKLKDIFKIKNVFFIMLLSSLIYATYDVLIKYLSTLTDVITYFILSIAGYVIGSLFLLFIPLYRKNTINTIKKLNKKTIIFISLGEIIGLVGVFFSFTAIKLSSVSLVISLESFQPLFVLILASILSFKFPYLLKEEINKKVLLIKIVSVILMISGVVLLYLR
jgi:uncharacterized membrane protein